MWLVHFRVMKHRGMNVVWNISFGRGNGRGWGLGDRGAICFFRRSYSSFKGRETIFGKGRTSLPFFLKILPAGQGGGRRVFLEEEGEISVLLSLFFCRWGGLNLHGENDRQVLLLVESQRKGCSSRKRKGKQCRVPPLFLTWVCTPFLLLKIRLANKKKKKAHFSFFFRKGTKPWKKRRKRENGKGKEEKEKERGKRKGESEKDEAISLFLPSYLSLTKRTKSSFQACHFF
mmetsp:Transcript_30536/g.79213  ORF Transcript_30536/g.79213 Transcript_30536/m.79213 type:complete len:231 (+) Transcript_30536:5672-6364(+)